MPLKKQQEPVKKLRSSNSMAAGNTAAANHDEDTGSQIPEIESSDPSAARAQSDRGNQWSDCGVEDNQVSVQISALAKQMSESQNTLHEAIKKLSTKMEQELCKSITNLTEKVNNHEFITNKFETLQTYAVDAHREIGDLKGENENRDKKISELEKELRDTKLNLGKLTHRLEKVSAEQQKLETYSRKHNVIFEGVNEDADENVTSKIIDIYTNKLMIQATKHDFDKIHRFGTSFNGKPRPIIVRCITHSLRDATLRNGKRLKGSNLFVNDDVPKEVKEQRMDLKTVAKHAMSQNKKVTRKGDLITIDNTRYEYATSIPTG